MNVRDRVFVDGRWTASAGTGLIEVVDPADDSIVGAVPAGHTDDVDRAVDAARRAQPGWAAVPPKDRLDVLARITEQVRDRADELAALISREMGAPITQARATQIGGALAVLDSLDDAYAEIPEQEQLESTLVVREPIGVVGAITPWNYPLFQVVLKVGPAIAAGCTVVLKPSELAPLSAFALADIAAEAGLPPGVLNVVSGDGPTVGEALAAHPGTDMTSFTGSTRVGKRIAQLGAATVKRVALELGGKSPFVLLDDADLDRAVPFGLDRCFTNAGQACVALSRMIVPRSRLAEVEDRIREAVQAFVPGPPADAATRLGPLASTQQRDRVLGHVRSAIAAGARLVVGGADPVDGLAGCYVHPTVFSDVTSDMPLAQDEVFGPVLAVLPYDDEDDAVRIANDTAYGLWAAVWSADRHRALAVARRIRAGSVVVNGAPMNMLAPFGGVKESGLGREMGRYGIEEYLELKSLRLDGVAGAAVRPGAQR